MKKYHVAEIKEKLLIDAYKDGNLGLSPNGYRFVEIYDALIELNSRLIKVEEELKREMPEVRKDGTKPTV